MDDQGDFRGAGWVGFAALMMMIIGGWGILQGIFALIDDEKIASLGGQIFLLDVTGWGWMHIIVGALVMLVGFGLMAGSRAAQFAALVLVTLNAIEQVFTIPVYPFWGITMLVVDVFVIWALTVYRPLKIDH